MPMMILVTSGRNPADVPRKRNEARTAMAMGCVPCYTFCDTAALLLQRFMRPMRFALDAERPIT
jgi:hypothetical protein